MGYDDPQEIPWVQVTKSWPVTNPHPCMRVTVRGHSGSPFIPLTSALHFTPRNIFHRAPQMPNLFCSPLNWTHCGSTLAALSPPTAWLPHFSFHFIFIMAWSHHTICHHISHHTTFILFYYFIVRLQYIYVPYLTGKFPSYYFRTSCQVSPVLYRLLFNINILDFLSAALKP